MTTRKQMFGLVSAGIVSIYPLMAAARTAQFALSAVVIQRKAQVANSNGNRLQPVYRGPIGGESTSSDRLSVAPSRTSGLILQGASVPPGAQGVVNRFIKSQESRSRGTEYAEGRKIVIGDLDNDGSPDVAVLYTLEGAHGGNDYNQYLAVFLNVNGKYVYKTHRLVGGRFERNMDLKSIEIGKVLFDMLEYLPKDPSCCPSKKGSTQFTLSEGKLVESKPNRTK